MRVHRKKEGQKGMDYDLSYRIYAFPGAFVQTRCLCVSRALHALAIHCWKAEYTTFAWLVRVWGMGVGVRTRNVITRQVRHSL